MYSLILPYPPSANRTIKLSHGKIYRADKCTRFYEEVWLAKQQKQIPSFPLEKRLFMEIYLYPPDKRRRDIDNLCRAVFNGFQYAEIVQDDFQFETLHVERREVKEGGACEVIFGII